MSSQEELKALFIRFLNNECSGDEIEWLMGAFETGENEDLLRSLVLRQLESSSVPEGSSAAVDQVYARLSQHIQESTSPAPTGPVRMYRLMKNIAVAASILAILGAGYWMFYARRQEKKPLASDNEKPLAVKDFAPGGDKAVLTLANGASIILDSAHNGTLSRQGDTRVLKLADGQLAYRAPTAEQGATLYNTVSTPKGGQYQVTLSDGTRVWLNAASSLRFPTAFAGTERKVEVTGEVYFEVAHNTAMPFIVKKGDMEVHVLGTHFNVNAYEDEADMKVTLLEGKVNITQRKDQQLLSPGQQAQIKRGEAIVVNSTTNLETVMAWKNGLFDFSSADIRTIMRQISRWYNIEVVYEGNIPDRQFSGKISRNTNASNVLKILELSNIHFKMEHERIVVMP